MLDSKKIILTIFFLLAICLRLFYFPQNTYFGFDQARDALAVREILNGDLKVTGPPTAAGVINHGVLYYYIFAPFYFFSGGDPSSVSLFLRILNSTGVFLIYLIVYPMFGVAAGLFSSFLFAISYEQTQFSLFLNHPSLAVISALLFYLGLSTWIFRKKEWGFLLALFGLGLSIQFEFVEIQLLAIFTLFLIVFRRRIPKLSIKKIIIIMISFFLPLSSYIISEVKNNFITAKQIPLLLLGSSSQQNQYIHFSIISRSLQDNILAQPTLAAILGLALLAIFIRFFLKKNFIIQLTFLALWFFGGLLVYFITSNDAYFYNTGTSISLLIFAAFLLSRTYSKNKIVSLLILSLVFASNIYLITMNNPLGPNQKINPQIGLLLRDQQKIIDFIYQKAEGEKFAVNALTMPYNVNTTWSYLFEWYGQKKYGYVPVWGGDAAFGFPGNLKIEKAKSRLPDKRFLIIEPLEGIPSYLIDSFIANEENYTNTIEKKNVGTMQVWVQKPK